MKAIKYTEKYLKDLFDIYMINPPQDKSKEKNNLAEALSGLGYSKEKVEGIVIGNDSKLFVDYVDAKYTFSKRILFLESKSSLVSCKYVYYYLLANKDRLDSLFCVVGRTFDDKLFSSIGIKYPSLEAQNDIVQELDFVKDMYEYQLDAYKYLLRYPASYYYRMEIASGVFWKSHKLGALAKVKILKTRNTDGLPYVHITPNKIEIANRKIIKITNINKEYNQYFLASVLLTSNFLRLLDSNFGIQNYRLENFLVKIPSVNEQERLEELFKHVESVLTDMLESIKQMEILKKYYFHYSLYRKNFGRDFPMMAKSAPILYSYENYTAIDSLRTYNTLREELFKSIEKGSIVQYFDAESQMVKLKRK